MAIRFDYLRGGRQVSLRGSSLVSIVKATAVAMLLSAVAAFAQYPVQMSKGNQDAPQMRAVAVLEWTGEEGHPKASRLVPVSVYDGQVLQDAGIYLAQPAPLALSSEVEYELKQDGKTIGLFDINNAGQEQGSWVGFGVWKPLPKPKPAAPAAKPLRDDSWGGDVRATGRSCIASKAPAARPPRTAQTPLERPRTRTGRPSTRRTQATAPATPVLRLEPGVRPGPPHAAQENIERQQRQRLG